MRLISWDWLAPLVALLVTLMAMQAAVASAGAMRRRDYRMFEDKSRESFARQFPLATIGQSPAGGQLDQGSRPRGTEQRARTY
jgi:hypothetical protein